MSAHKEALTTILDNAEWLGRHGVPAHRLAESLMDNHPEALADGFEPWLWEQLTAAHTTGMAARPVAPCPECGAPAGTRCREWNCQGAWI